MKFNFRKIASVLTGTLMVGSTVAFAAAANYPAPFVNNGSANAAIVYGSTGAMSDLVAVADIQTSLSSELAKQTATSSSTSTSTSTTSTSSSASGGDSYKIEKTSTKFHLGNGVLQVISGKVTNDNLPTLLADGVYVDTNNDEFDYTQEVSLANLTLTQFVDNDYKADTPTVGIRIPSGSQILNYTLDFTDEPQWADLATTDLSLMGKTYYVLSKSTNESLTLLDSAESAVVNEGETKTLTVDGKPYEIKISALSGSAASPKVKLEVNGEVTKALDTSSAATYKLKDGTYVGIRDISMRDVAGTLGSVEFSVGKGKLVIEDGQEVQMNDQSINGLTASFTNSAGEKLNKIALQWTADDDLFVAEDKEVVMPGFGALKLSYGGMTFPSNEDIAVEPDSDNSFKLNNFPLKDSTEDINLVYWAGGNFSVAGKEPTHQLRTTNGTSITFDGNTDDQFVVSWSDGSDAESYLMRATSFVTDNSVDKATIQYKKGGSWETLKKDAADGDTVSIGNVDLTVGTVTKSAKTVGISTADSDVSFNTLYSNEGMKINLPFAVSSQTVLSGNYSTEAAACTAAIAKVQAGALLVGTVQYNGTSEDGAVTTAAGACASTFKLIATEEDKNENKGAGSSITMTLGVDSSGDTSVTGVSLGGSDFQEIGSSSVDQAFVYSALATEVKFDKSADQQKVTLTYHGDESSGNVYLNAPSTTVTTSNGTTIGGGSKELGSISVKDTEVASVAGKNLIVVGGSCVNTVAAELLGATAGTCGADFTAKTGVGAGSFLIETFSRTGGQVATLVAGYNAADTTNAAKYLTTQSVDTTVGKKYKGSSETSAELVTS